MLIEAGFLQAAGATFGLVGGGAVLGLAVKVGASWNDLKRDVKETRSDCGDAKTAAAETKATLNDDICPRLQRLEQTLHGPEGNNGLYQTVRQIEQRMRDESPNPGRRADDQRAA